MKKSKPAKNKQAKSYVMKTTRKMLILRVVLWVAIGFIFLRGVISCIRPNKASELNQIIDQFKTEYYGTKDTNYETLGFAENFCMEYLTYDKDKEQFGKRISPYFSKKVNIEEIYDFNNICEATDVHAYKIDEISKNQVDVYVHCQVMYTFQDTKTRKEVILKVPVYVGESGYIIEDIPMYINDSMYDGQYEADVTFDGGKSIDPEPYETTITSFLTAYYNSDQNAVNYILSADADARKFRCLGNLYSFTKLDNLQTFDISHGKILCLVSFKITDTSSGAIILQNINVTLTDDGKRLYVKDMNTKIINLEDK